MYNESEMTILSKICSCCRENKEVSAFSKNRADKSGYDHYCKTCKKDWQERNKEEINERRIVYRHEKGISKNYGRGNRTQNNNPNRYRFSKTGKAYTYDWSEVRKVIYKRDNWHCQICDVKCSQDGKTKIQCHHIDDNSLNNSSDNLITLCASCHMRLHKAISNKWRELVKLRTKKVSKKLWLTQA